MEMYVFCVMILMLMKKESAELLLLRWIIVYNIKKKLFANSVNMDIKSQKKENVLRLL